MTKLHLTLGLLLAALIGCSTANHGTRGQALFNGHDLRGWYALHGGEWVVQDEVLIGRNGTNWSTNPEKSGSWLRSEKTYGDFALELEYAISERGNSGVFIRSAFEKNPAFTGYEMQILDDRGQEPAKFRTGALYDVVAPTKNMSHAAGEWNRVRIVAKGRRVQVTINGEQVVDYVTDRSVRGYIGLQNHDSRTVVKFRNIRLTEL
jgi:hypothetical protein